MGLSLIQDCLEAAQHWQIERDAKSPMLVRFHLMEILTEDWRDRFMQRSCRCAMLDVRLRFAIVER